MFIKYIKIFGERNSGTRFLEEFLKKNTKNIQILSSIFDRGSGWKHGTPKINLFNNTQDILFIFIIRDIKPWLKAMIEKPYHYQIQKKKIDSFLLNNNLQITERRKDHDMCKYSYENQNIFDLRYFKINSYLDFFKIIENSIFINLEDLQSDNHKFLNFLKNTYNINIRDKILSIEKHTKDKENKTQTLIF